MTKDAIAKLPTPRTEAVAPHLNLSHGDMNMAAWNLRRHARTLEQKLAAAVMALQTLHDNLAEYQRVYNFSCYNNLQQARETLAAIKEM